MKVILENCGKFTNAEYWHSLNNKSFVLVQNLINMNIIN